MTAACHSPTVRRVLPAVAILIVMALPGFLPAVGVSMGRPAAPASTPATASETVAASPAAHPLDPTDNYTCYKINTTICVSARNGSYNVVPTPGNLTSNVLPLPNATIDFLIKSEFPLTVPTSLTTNHNDTPIRINVTGVLWNGDPYMNQYDGTVWHSNTNSNYWSTVTGVTNVTYKYWYQVVIDGNNSGVPNFFPGEFVSWSIYIVTFHKASGHYTELSSTVFHYRIATAWAFSPYPAASQYAGPDASTLDLQVYQNPLVPNWNDVTNISIQTTAADAADNNSCLIGSALLDLSATLPDGTLLPNVTIDFRGPPTGSYGIASSSAQIPASYSQVPGTVISYTITAWDGVNTAHFTPDEIRLPSESYTVHGNGTFVSGVFEDDLQVRVTPSTGVPPTIAPYPTPSTSATPVVLPPGTSVVVLVTSSNPGTSLQSGIIAYTFELPVLHETVQGQFFLDRVNSTNLAGLMPAVPIGGYMNFTITIWDYASTPETSKEYGYAIQTFGQSVQSGPQSQPNLGFLWIYVYDNGTHAWVSGALVSIVGSAGFVNVRTKTLFGIAYPNETAAPEVPLLLPVNVSYNISLTDPHFLPSGALTAPTISVPVTLRNPMNGQATLRQTSDYTVVLSGSSLFFWLNSTAPGATFSPPLSISTALLSPLLLVPAIGLLVAVAAMLPLLWWWRDIANRRREQEKKVTL